MVYLFSVSVKKNHDCHRAAGDGTHVKSNGSPTDLEDHCEVAVMLAEDLLMLIEIRKKFR
jgi:hypothetical protein